MPRSTLKNGSNPTPAISQGAHHPLANEWPKGTKQRLTRKLAKAFFDVVAKSDDSIFAILHRHPEFPPYSSLYFWKLKHPWFAQMWQQAREQQAEFLVQKSFDIAKNTTPATAHVSRVQFDIYRWLAGRFNPNIYGDKPANNQFQTNVNLNVSLITNDKLTELRQRLTPTRIFIKEKSEPGALTNGSEPDSASRQQLRDTQAHEK